MRNIAAIVLAAGKGTRMRSRWPKVLHQVAGKHMVSHVVDAARSAGVGHMVVVIGHGAELVERALGDGLIYAYQRQQLGTGHAVMQAEDHIPAGIDTVMVLYGDTPLLTSETLRGLLEYHQEEGAAATILTAFPEDPAGYGRVIRDEEGSVSKIIEERDATPEEREVGEINTGTYCFASGPLFAALKRISPANAQGEYYLTDVIGLLKEQGLPVAALAVFDPQETKGINSRVDLAAAEKELRQRINRKLMESGVTIIDPGSTFIDAGVTILPDSVIYPFTTLQGSTVIGAECAVGPHALLTDCRLGDGVTIRYTVAEQAVIGDRCVIGPFAYLRPETVLHEGVKIGDFVEIKKSVIGTGSKVPHLTYIGDTSVGRDVNIGAGTITCNYDGKGKYPTIIEDGAFVGSNTNLVAPVKVGAGAVIGAGSTITKDVPAGALGVARGRQNNIEGWAHRRDQT
ncbi:bifunctional N-acetylglucosamine-1-phosphate uridyltransferase/glucosamine-1-phosphate acetyltransferase [Clostridiales bacterium PH28_bin88]|nr:bifunctional N-acetylglucosamine-1-phosphate uridyltransferase/glucosamine-1-phosphate acetyltransferase [Clostridiales bacterium PH28_bin88]